MRKVAVALVLALLSALAITTSPASASTAPFFGAMSAQWVTLYPNSSTRASVTVHVHAPTGGAQDVTVQVSGGNHGTGFDYQTARLVQGTIYDGYWRATFTYTKASDAGAWVAQVDVSDDDFNTAQLSKDFFVRYNTYLPTYDASPEPIRYGSALKVAGQLKYLHPTAGYRGYAGKRIDIYFVPRGSRTATRVGYTTTNRSGYFARYFSATRDGTWHARFAGTVTYDSTWGPYGDYVDVV